jgi:hypothetical protein
MDDVARALADEDPLSLLALASTLLTVVDERTRDPFDPPDERDSTLGREELVGSLLGVPLRETTAVLAAFAEMTGDEVLATRIRRELARRDDALPDWLVGLAGVEADGAVEMVHVLGDGDNVMVGLRFPTGHELAVVVYIDHNLGTVVKDAFVVPESLDALVRFMREKSGDDPDTSWNEMDAADARVRITEAIDRGAMTFPPFETETWPACRPLVEWAARLLPHGGRGYDRPEWEEGALETLAARFWASPFAAGLDPDHRSLLDLVLWFATGYGPGDPLRWSPVAVEILLADWIPRKIVAGVGYLSKAPDLVRAFVRFCHAERGIRHALTAETLAAVDEFEPDYQLAIRTPRPQGPEALLAALGVLGGEGPWAPDEPVDFREAMLDALSRAVGGEQALDTLDDQPLPDEQFSWEGVPDDVRAPVGDVVALCDRCCDELLDVEYRTACRRFVNVVATRGGEAFRRRARAETTAAAVCWIVGKANDLFSPAGGGMRVKDVMGHFGQASASQRATALLRAGGFNADHYEGVELGSPRFLVSARRRSILTRRDRYRAMLDEG